MVPGQRISRETFARFVEHHESLPSTNDLAMRQALDPRTETPRLILAAEQTAGRGRGANRWWSGAGALTFTVLFEPGDFSISAPRWPCVALTAAVAICDILPRFAPHAPCGLKWPNDVWLEGKKVCGILVEVPQCRPPVPPRLVLGVGLNVNNSTALAPDEIRSRATAMCDVAGAPLDPGEVLIAFLKQLEASLTELGGDHPSPSLIDRWQSRCALRGHEVTVDSAGNRITGRCRGIDQDGSLLLETASGLSRVYAGTVVAWTE